jgi:anti-sigma factor RsiW
MKTKDTEGANKSEKDSEREACHECARLVGAFLDGVLDAAKTLEVDEHLAGCETCRERVELERAVRGSLKKAVSQVAMGDTARARMLAAMQAAKAGEPIPVRERTKSEADLEKQKLEASQSKLLSWRTMVPLASAAALALLWNSVSQTAPQSADNGHQTDVMRAGFVAHDPLEDLVAQHSQQPLPPERTDPKDLRGFEQYVGVPVHAPQYRSQNARLLGGRVTTVHQQRAAMMQYRMGQGPDAPRVTVFIYDPQKIQVGRAEQLTPRAIGTSEVRGGRVNGYSVAVRGGVDGGVGYVIVSDLDPDRTAQLAVATDDD